MYGNINTLGPCKPIIIEHSATADTRSCDYANVSREQLLLSSIGHISDVAKAMQFFVDLLNRAADAHDFDKLTEIDHFHHDFRTGFKETGWWDNHRVIHRHHLNSDDGVPYDVNLVDVIEYICDCVTSGMARPGSVYPLAASDDLLRRAFENTVHLLQMHVVVLDKKETPSD